MKDEADDAATPITPAERDGLIPTHVALRGELNELEQQNIAEASAWAFARKRNVLNEAFLRGLHRRMFNNVWRWAGKYRTTARNLGVKPHLIQPRMIQAIDDACSWIEYESYEADELALRFHHKDRPGASISKRERTLVAPGRRFARHEAGKPPVQLGRRQPSGVQRCTQELYRRAPCSR